jgi:cyclic-di-GMP phosphodiesterase TipF (flagellum assembly factor)
MSNPGGKVVPLHQPAGNLIRAAKSGNDDPGQKQQAVLYGPELGIDKAVRAIRQNNSSLAGILHEAVKSASLELHLQPIVDLHSHKPVYYETMLRLKGVDEHYVDPRQLAETAKTENLLAAMDFQHLFDAVRMLRALDKMGKKAGLLCSVTRSTLNSTAAFDEMLSFLKANKSLSKWLIIEVLQSDWDNLDNTGLQRLAQIVDLGYFLALGNVRRFDIDGAYLHFVGFRFVKVSVAVLFSDSAEGGVAAHPAIFSAEMERCGIAIIACQIAREAEVLDLIDLDLPLGQGDHFSAPRPVKAELLGPVGSDPGLSGLGLA